MGELINGRTPEEIKSGLRHCWVRCKGGEDGDCPYYDDCSQWGATKNLEKDALALIEHLEAERDAALAKVPKWISVEERLPWMNQKVLVSDGSIVTEAHYNGRGEWIHNGHDMAIGGVIVTHWMPLPDLEEM